MKERFERDAGRRRLIDALKTQKMVAGNATLAEELASLVEVLEIKAGETIIRQGLPTTISFSFSRAVSMLS